MDAKQSADALRRRADAIHQRLLRLSADELESVDDYVTDLERGGVVTYREDFLNEEPTVEVAA